MKAYFVGDDETGFAYVLNNRKEALALRAKVSSEMDIPFTEVRVREIKKANIDGLSYGEVKEYSKDTVKRGIFACYDLEDSCDKCGRERYLSLMDNSEFWCSECEEGE